MLLNRGQYRTTPYCFGEPKCSIWLLVKFADTGFWLCGSRYALTLVPRATLRGVAELYVGSGMPQWRMFVTSCYI